MNNHRMKTSFCDIQRIFGISFYRIIVRFVPKLIFFTRRRSTIKPNVHDVTICYLNKQISN